MSFRRAKIVCTLGPASRSAHMIERLMRAGMDVARLNFSHGTQASTHAKTVVAHSRRRRSSSKPHAPSSPICAAKKFAPGALEGGLAGSLRAGQQFTISKRDERTGDATGVSTTFKMLPREVHRGDRILLSDGFDRVARAVRTARWRFLCRVVNGGNSRRASRASICRACESEVPALDAQKTCADLAFALDAGRELHRRELRAARSRRRSRLKTRGTRAPDTTRQ